MKLALLLLGCLLSIHHTYCQGRSTEFKIDSIQALIDAAPNDSLRGYYIQAQCLVYLKDQRYTECLSCSGRALDFLKTIAIPLHLARIYQWSAWSHYEMGNSASARQDFLQSIAAFKSAGEHYKAAMLNGSISNVFLQEGNYHDARAHIAIMMDMMTKLNDAEGIHFAKLLLANVCITEGKREDALGLYLSVLDYYEKTGNKEKIADVKGYLGSIYVDLKRYDEARTFTGRL